MSRFTRLGKNRGLNTRRLKRALNRRNAIERKRLAQPLIRYRFSSV